MTTRLDPTIRFLQPYHFLRINNGNLVFWDYKNHNQFEITFEHLARLVELSTGSPIGASNLDQEIAEAGVLTDGPSQQTWGWDWLAHIFHFGTCHPSPPENSQGADSSIQYARDYLDFCAKLAETEPEPEVIKGGEAIALPHPDLSTLQNAPLWDVLSRRRTCRDFDGRPVALETVSNLLFAAFGDQKFADPTAPANARSYGFRRTSPAAGALQSTEPYLWAMRVDGLAPGIYHYLSCRHQLEVVRPELPELSLGRYLCNQNWSDDMAFAVVMTCRFDKMWWKYPHSRAYRPMLMEVGHLSQTLNLCITASGLHPWITGYFHDIQLAEVLGCTPDIEYPLLIVGGGTGSGSPYDRVSRQLFDSEGLHE